MSKRELEARYLWKFLHKYGLFNKWFNNFTNQRIWKCRDFLTGEEGVIGLLERAIDIDRSFNWSETPEGHIFWNKYNCLEKAELMQLKRDMDYMNAVI